jgi:hypothetical protein
MNALNDDAAQEILSDDDGLPLAALLSLSVWAIIGWLTLQLGA